MGYDITFHPVDPSALSHYLFDVIRDPSLAPACADTISASKRKRREVRDGVYAPLVGIVEELRATQSGFGTGVAFAAAAVAGYLHPYWYARGSALTFLVAKNRSIGCIFTSLADLPQSRDLGLVDDSCAFLTGNYSASGIVLPDQLQAVQQLIVSLPQAEIKKTFDPDGFDALMRAMTYAAERGLGLLEASDLVVPIMDESYTDRDNLRAHFLKNQDRQELGRAKASRKRVDAG